MSIPGPNGRAKGVPTLICAIVLWGCAERRAVLPPLVVPPESDCSFRYSDAVTLYCRRLGDGMQPVVLLHGFGASSETWRDVEGPLSSGRALYMPDLKGFGRSSKPNDGAYAPDEHARIVAAFIEGLSLTDVVLVGHSFGGGVALLAHDILRARPVSRLRALVLIDAAVYEQELPGFMRLLRTPIVNRIVLGVTSPSFQARTILKQSFRRPETITRERVRRHAQFLDTPGAHDAMVATARQIDDIPPESIAAVVTGVNVPVLIVWGANDHLVPLTSGRRLNREIMGSRLEAVADCGHIPHEECSGATAEAILAFLRGLPQSTLEPAAFQ